MLHPVPHLPGADGAIVEFEGVAAGYQRGPVIHGVSFQITAGDFVGLLGPSGAGKSTILRTILGDTRVYEGAVHVAGRLAGDRHASPMCRSSKPSTGTSRSPRRRWC